MLDQAGQVVSGTMSNLFVQRGGELLTPPVARAGIEGVVRGLLIECAGRVGEGVRIEAIGLAELYAAEALYLCNSLLGVVRVDRLEDHVYDPATPVPAAVALARDLCHRPDAEPGRHA